jgi:hypothetical protein
MAPSQNASGHPGGVPFFRPGALHPLAVVGWLVSSVVFVGFAGHEHPLKQETPPPGGVSISEWFRPRLPSEFAGLMLSKRTHGDGFRAL